MNTESNELPAKRIRGKVEKITQHEIDELNERHRRIHRAAAEVAAEVVALGEKLTSIKQRLPHGKWGQWVERNLDFTIRTATRYMKAYEKRIALLSVDPEDFMANIWGNEPKEIPDKSDVTSDDMSTSDSTEQDDDEEDTNENQHGGDGLSGLFPDKDKADFYSFARVTKSLYENVLTHLTPRAARSFIDELIKWLEGERKKISDEPSQNNATDIAP